VVPGHSTGGVYNRKIRSLLLYSKQSKSLIEEKTIILNK
jgi:hypothetical protein